MITYILLFLVILIILCLAISNKRKTKEGFLYTFSLRNQENAGGANYNPPYRKPNDNDVNYRGTINERPAGKSISGVYKLGRCEGDCDGDGQCGRGLQCKERNRKESVPTCDSGGTHGWDYCYPKNTNNYLDSFRNTNTKYLKLFSINRAPTSYIGARYGSSDLNRALREGAYGLINHISGGWHGLFAGGRSGKVNYEIGKNNITEIKVIGHMPNLSGSTTLHEIWQTTIKNNYSSKLHGGDVLTIIITTNSGNSGNNDKIARVNYPWRNKTPTSSIYRVKGGVSPTSYNFVNDAEEYKQIKGGEIKDENGVTKMNINNLERIYPTDCEGRFDPCNDQCKKTYRITKQKNGGNDCKDGGNVIKDGYVKVCKSNENLNDECKPIDCVGTWNQTPGQNDPCKISFGIQQLAKFEGTCVNKGKAETLFPGQTLHGHTCPKIGECKITTNEDYCGAARNGERLISYLHTGGKLEGCNTKDEYDAGKYCYKQSDLNTILSRNAALDGVEANLGEVNCFTDGKTFNPNTVGCEGFANIFKRKGNLLEGFSNADALKKNANDANTVPSKEFIDYLIETLNLAKERLNSPEQRRLEADTSEEARRNADEWKASKYQSYKNLLGRFYDFTQNKNNRVNTALLRDIVGFDIVYEKKFSNFCDNLGFEYEKYVDIEANNDNKWPAIRKEIDLTVLALKIFKWKVSNEYIKYFLKADKEINDGKEFRENITSPSFSDFVNEKNQTSSLDLTDLKAICSNLVSNEKKFIMKKLNEELFDTHTNNPANDISNYVKAKAKKAKESNTKQCIEMSNQKRNERLSFNGCSQKSFFQKEIDFIFQAPKNDSHLVKILLDYGVFVFSNKDEKINFTTKLTKKTSFDADHQQFGGTDSYIKNLSDNVKADNAIIVGYKSRSINSNSELDKPYERPRWPLWGFNDIDYKKFTKSTEGFTTLTNKHNKFAQKTRRVKHNPINDVISFFKRNIFGKSVAEGFDTMPDAAGVKVVCPPLAPSSDSSASAATTEIAVSKKVLIDVDGSNNLWYVHVFNNASMSANSPDKKFFNNLMSKIENDFYPKSNIYDYDSGEEKKSRNNDFKNELFGVQPNLVNPTVDNWSKAIVHLYINDDGYSAIVVDIKNEDNTVPFPEVNDREVIKKLLVDKTFLTDDHNYYLKINSDENYHYDPENSTFTGTSNFGTIKKNRRLLTIPRGLLHVSFDDVNKLCGELPDGFDPVDTVKKLQQCKGVKFATNCRLNYIKPDDSNNLGALPRCFESDGTTMNSLLTDYEKKCINIAGMKEDGDTGKCITNTDYPGTGGNGAKMEGSEHLRSCYLYKDGLTKKCDPGKRDSGDCLCDFSIKSKDTANDANPFSLTSNIKGTPIVKDSYCKAVGDKDLSWEQCMEYAGWVLGGKDNVDSDNFKSNGFFNDGLRMGCNIKSTEEGSTGTNTEFNYIDPTNRYGKTTRTRRWGEITNIDKGELETLEKYQNDKFSSVCMTDYTIEQRGQVASKIDKQEVEVVKGIEIPGLISKNLTTGEPLITELNTLDRDMAKTQCDSKTSWDGCFMTGSKDYLIKGNDMIKDKGYLEYNVYGEYKDDTVEGFRSMREGMANDLSSCKVPNCAPSRFMNGNCDDDVKTTKDVNGIQRFFKLCPQECLTPIDPRYKDMGWSRGQLDSAGNPIVYDPMKHGCITNKQCQDNCDKTQVQVKHVYDNLCKDDEECSLSLMKSQYDVETDAAGSRGKIKYNNSIKIGMVRLTRDIKRKYGPKQGVATQPGEGGNREVAIFKYIEEMKKQSVLQIVGFCFKEKDEDANDVLMVIYKKKNVMSKIEINPVEKDWITYIHKRTWKDYWHDPNRPTLQSLDRGLTEEEMQRIQGVNLGISLDAFDAIPLYWQNDKDREVNSADLCEWIDGKIKAGELKDKDKCDTRFKSSWDSRALSIGKTPTKGLNFEEFQQVYNLKDFAEQSSPYTDMSNSMDIGQPDLSLDDFYKRNILKSKVENRLGGSENAYTKTYKPINPNARPRFFDSTWSLFH
mgnify:CR=1 FL=1